MVPNITKLDHTSFSTQMTSPPEYILPPVKPAPAPIADAEYKQAYYVDTSGNDRNPGSLEQPFQTISRARDAVRFYKRNHPTGNITVFLRGGNYYIDETITFGIEDSGNSSQFITYMNYPGEHPVISSGKAVIQWKKPTSVPMELAANAQDHVYMADIPEGLGNIKTLYHGDQRLRRARSAGFLPDEKYSSWKGPLAARGSFHFPAGAMEPYGNLQDVEVLVRPTAAWGMSIMPLASVDTTTRLASTTVPSIYTIGRIISSAHIPDETIWVENALQYLDEPGEWVVDTVQGKIYLWPIDGNKPDHIYAPSLEQYIAVNGDIDAMTQATVPVTNLVFSGLSFVHGERYSMNADPATVQLMQHGWDLYDTPNALIGLRGAKDIVIKNCIFTNSGGNAIRMDLYSMGNKIYGNEISHIGGTGVLMDGYAQGIQDVHRDNQVVNNNIHDVGEIYWYSPAIFAWQSGHNWIAYNRISNNPYNGIVVSGRMEKGENPPRLGNGNTVEYNDITRVMNVLADGNAIYISGTCLSATTGACESNVVRRNRIHNVTAEHASEMIRTDDQQNGTQISQNLIYDIAYGNGIVDKMNNNVVNNIVAGLDHQNASFFRLAKAPPTGSIIQRNIAYSQIPGQTIFIEGKKTPPPYVRDTFADYNNYFNAADRNWAHSYFQLQRSHGVELNSMSIDPKFYDADQGDFRLKPESPMWGLGFQQFDSYLIGLTADYPYADQNEEIGRLYIKAGDHSSFIDMNTGETITAAVYGRTVSGFVKDMTAIPLHFSSSDSSVATVADDGQITAMGTGKACITVLAQGVSTSIEALVNDHVAFLYVATVQSLFKTGNQQHLHIGGTTVLGNDKSIPSDQVKWFSSNPHVAVVDKHGILSPAHEGTTELVATWHDGVRTLTIGKSVMVTDQLPAYIKQDIQ